MRIGFIYDAVYPFTRGGAERRYWELARRLAKEHEVHMISWQYWDGPALLERDGVWLHGVGPPPPLYTAAGRRSIREAIAFGVRIALADLPDRFDVVDCCAFPYFHLFTERLRSLTRREPLVVTWHEYWGDYWAEYIDGLAARAGRLVERAALPMADRYLSVSEHTADRLSKHGARRPIDVVPNGIDLAAIEQGAIGSGCERSASELGRPDVIYVGRLIQHKRVDLLLRALAVLRDRGVAVRATIVGSGPEEDSLCDLASELSVANAVTWAGNVADDQVYELMRRSALLVLPSEREGFGMTVLEAAGCGTPALVVRAPHSAASEIVRHGETGVVTDATPGAIADGICQVLDEPRARYQFGACAREHARRFDWARIVDETFDVYERAIAGKRG